MTEKGEKGMKGLEGLTLVHYCHKNCEPLHTIMSLPREEAFALAGALARENPEETAFGRFADFENYYPGAWRWSGGFTSAFSGWAAGRSRNIPFPLCWRAAKCWTGGLAGGLRYGRPFLPYLPNW